MRRSIVRPVLSPIAHKSLHCGSGDHARLYNGRSAAVAGIVSYLNDPESW